MATKIPILTDAMIKAIPPPTKAERLRIVRDGKVRGLAVRVLPTGTKAFVLDYTSAASGRHLYTIGRFPSWKIAAARVEAVKFQAGIKHGGQDPAEQLRAARDVPTVANLIEQFRQEHLPKLRPSTRSDYERMLENDIKPELGNRKVAAIHYADLAKLHR